MGHLPGRAIRTRSGSSEGTRTKDSARYLRSARIQGKYDEEEIRFHTFNKDKWVFQHVGILPGVHVQED